MIRLNCLLSVLLVISGSALAQQSFLHHMDAGPVGTVAAVHEPGRVKAGSAASDPKAMLHGARTIYIRSKTAFVSAETLTRALVMEQGWQGLGLTIVADARLADVVVEVHRPLFAYVQSFVLADGHTATVLGTGRVTAFDGGTASSSLATGIVQMVQSARAAERGAKL